MHPLNAYPGVPRSETIGSNRSSCHDVIQWIDSGYLINNAGWSSLVRFHTEGMQTLGARNAGLLWFVDKGDRPPMGLLTEKN